jgi:hypothetical protein
MSAPGSTLCSEPDHIAHSNHTITRGVVATVQLSTIKIDANTEVKVVMFSDTDLDLPHPAPPIASTKLTG